MIDTTDSGLGSLTNTIIKWFTALVTTGLGAVNRFAFDVSVVHEVLADISMAVGIVACIALIRVHILKGNQIALENREFQKTHPSREQE